MIFFRTMVMYLVLLGVVRLIGKRQIGQLAASEFVVTMLVANLAAIPLENRDQPLSHGLYPIATIFLAEVILSFLTLKSIWLRKLLCGKPVILVENGVPDRQALRKNRITLDELTGQLRLKDVMDIRQVQYAILENNGSISVFLYPEEDPAPAKEAGVKVSPRYLPVTVIQDGAVFPDDLRRMGKDEAWLQKALRDRKLREKDVLLMTLDKADGICLIRKKQ